MHSVEGAAGKIGSSVLNGNSCSPCEKFSSVKISQHWEFLFVCVYLNISDARQQFDKHVQPPIRSGHKLTAKPLSLSSHTLSPFPTCNSSRAQHVYRKKPKLGGKRRETSTQSTQVFNGGVRSDLAKRARHQLTLRTPRAWTEFDARVRAEARGQAELQSGAERARVGGE